MFVCVCRALLRVLRSENLKVSLVSRVNYTHIVFLVDLTSVRPECKLGPIQSFLKTISFSKYSLKIVQYYT